MSFPVSKKSPLASGRTETGLDKHHAHDLVVDYFANVRPGEWKVTPHAYGMPTAWKLEFEFRTPATPANAKLPIIGFIAEYDMLVGIGHACGHNQILLHGGQAFMAGQERGRKAAIIT